MSDDPEYKPSQKISGLYERNRTRSYRAPRDSDSDDANYETAVNLDMLVTLVSSENDDIANPDNMGDQQEAIRQMKEAFEAVAVQTRNNDMRNLTELPYFGIASDPEGKKWVTDSCNEFIAHVEKATTGDAWNDQGRIRVLRSKLLGPALEYFNDFEGENVDEATAFLYRMFHDPTTYASVSAEIERFKRRTGEQIPFIAIRIAKLYQKLKRVSTADLTDEWIDKSKKELLLKLMPGAVRNFVKVDEDIYDVLLEKIVDYLEINSQHNLTRADIDTEREKEIRRINLIKEKASKATSETNNKNNKTQTDQNTKTENDQTISVVTSPPDPPNNNNQNNNNSNNNSNFYRGRGRGYGRGYGRGRG